MIILSGLQGGGGGHHGGGHHGGGHHHGGHHHGGGHHHHHGGYAVPGSFYYGNYGPYYYDDYEYTPTCPYIYAPVLGYDGKIYDNECFARAAGTDVLRVLRPGDTVEKPGVSGFGSALSLVGLAGVGAALVKLFRR